MYCIWSALVRVQGGGRGVSGGGSRIGDWKLVGFSHLHGESLINIHVRAIPPSSEVDWMLAAVFTEVRDKNLLSVEVTETVFCCGCGVGEDMDGVSASIKL